MLVFQSLINVYKYKNPTFSIEENTTSCAEGSSSITAWLQIYSVWFLLLLLW